MNPPADLGGKHFKPLLPEQTRGALLRRRRRGRNGQVVSRVQGAGLIDDPQIALELLELAAHPIEPPDRCLFSRLYAGGKKVVERGLHDRRPSRTCLFGGCFEPLKDLFRKLYADFVFHGLASSPLG
jgi:hypothetical protein